METPRRLAEKMHRMAHRTAQECLQLTKDELSKHSGHEFDQAFVGSQIGAHIGMLAKLKAAETETSPKLSQWTIKAQETTKMHKEHLQELMESISKKERGKN